MRIGISPSLSAQFDGSFICLRVVQKDSVMPIGSVVQAVSATCATRIIDDEKNGDCRRIRCASMGRERDNRRKQNEKRMSAAETATRRGSMAVSQR